MTNRDDIYDHLAQVYLGKRKGVDEEKKKKQYHAWLGINFIITAIIFASAFYGLTAFLTQNNDRLQDNIIFSLHRGPVRFSYNFKDSLHPVETFSLKVPVVDLSKYQNLEFSVRAQEEGSPGVLKVEFRNRKQEVSAYYVQGINYSWKTQQIPLEKFNFITDWTALDNLSFKVESWNVEDKTGVVLIDDIHFTRTN